MVSFRSKYPIELIGISNSISSRSTFLVSLSICCGTFFVVFKLFSAAIDIGMSVSDVIGMFCTDDDDDEIIRSLSVNDIISESKSESLSLTIEDETESKL